MWNNFYTTESGYTSERMNNTAIFLGYMGTLCGVKYGIDGSPTQFKYVRSAVDALLGGILNKKNETNREDIRKVLYYGYPILAGSSGYTIDSQANKNENNHIYIIDYLLEIRQTITEFWAYRLESPGEPVFDPSVYFDENTTKEDVEKRCLGPVTEITNVYRSYFVKMNWGWGGYCDDVSVNIDALTLTFKTNNKTFYYGFPQIVYPASIDLEN